MVCNLLVSIFEASRTTRMHPEDPGLRVSLVYAIACFDRYLGLPASKSELAFFRDFRAECTLLLLVLPAPLLRRLCISRGPGREHLCPRSRDHDGTECISMVSVGLRRQKLRKIEHLSYSSKPVRRCSLHCCMNWMFPECVLNLLPMYWFWSVAKWPEKCASVALSCPAIIAKGAHAQ